MEEEDPRISSSQESLLRRSRFYELSQSPAPSVEEDENCHIPATIPVDSTPIIEVSTEESPDDDNAHLEDLLHTPLEGTSSANLGEDHRTLEVGCNRVEDNVPVDSEWMGCLSAVDLGRDTDLGFSLGEVELAQRTVVDLDQNAAFRSRADEPRVSKSGSSLPIERSPLKRLNISGSESVNVRLGTAKENSREEFPKSSQKFKCTILSPSPINVYVPVTDNDMDFSEMLGLEDKHNLRSTSEDQDIHISRVTGMNPLNLLKCKGAPTEMRTDSENVAEKMRDSMETLERRNQLNHPSCPTDVIESEMEKRGKEISIGETCIAKEKRVLPPSINSTVEAAKSPMSLLNRAVASTSSNATQGAAAAVATASSNVTQETIRNKLKALVDVLKALSNSKYYPIDDNLKSLSLMDIARRRGVVVTPRWWPPGGYEIKK